jgi:Flp pilus assembly protein TadG
MDQRKPSSNRLNRFARNNDGATAVEFALVAPLFLSLMLTIMFSGLTLFANSVLQNMLDKAARQVRTGQMQGATLQQFMNAICDPSKPEILFSCGGIRVQSRPITASSNPACFSRTSSPPASCFNPGSGAPAPDMVIIQATYEWPLPLTVRLWPNPDEQAGQGEALANTMLVATTVLQNEPF